MVDRQSAQPSASEAKTAKVELHRRGLLRTMLGSLFGLGMSALGLTGALWSAATGRFMFPNVLTEPAERFTVGSPGDYPPDYVQTRFKGEHGIWVVRGRYRGHEEIFALRTVCTHLGCITIWQQAERKFKCPCHGSGFSADGVNSEGPAPRPLERYAIGIAADGQLEVDKSRIFREELGQWNDPACYVSV